MVPDRIGRAKDDHGGEHTTGTAVSTHGNIAHPSADPSDNLSAQQGTGTSKDAKNGHGAADTATTH
jgi:hypothetical protein